MSVHVELHRLAARELRAVHARYLAASPDVARRFLDAFDAAVARIRAEPETHPIERRNFRWVRVRRFPYRHIFESTSPDAVLVLAVAHTSRRPGYWRGRT